VTQQFEAPHPNGAVTVNERPKRRRLRRQILLGLVIVVGIAWGYAIWYSVTQRSPENLDDDAHTAVARACSTARRQLDALPDLPHGADASENVSLVRSENEIFTRMTDQIDAIHTDGGDAQKALAGWVGDWRKLIVARRDFADDLASDGTARLLIPTTSSGGPPITRRMNQYASQRSLDVCSSTTLQAEVVDGPRDYSTIANEED
jgi:hypothetical protein